MKIVYLTLRATAEGQAAHAHVHEIVAGLRDLDHDVALAEVDYRGKRPSTWSRLKACSQVQFTALRLARGSDVLYVRLHPLTVFTILSARLLRIPSVLEVNGTPGDVVMAWPTIRHFERALVAVFAWQMKLASRVVVVTQQLKNWAIAEGVNEDDIAVISNGANTRLFVPATRLGVEKDCLTVVFFGALSRWQGVATMLEAVSLEEWPDEVRLRIIGDGEMAAQVQDAAGYLQQVEYLGKRGYRELPGILAPCLASLIPKEGPFEEGGLMPLKLFESLAAGLPVIVTDYPGIADAVRDNRCGVVMQPGNARALALAVAEMAADPRSAQIQGERGRRWVEESHSWQARAGATSDLLGATVGGR